MKKQRGGKTLAGTVALVALMALSWLAVPTAKAGDAGIPAVLRLLQEVLANQAILLNQLEAVTAPDLVPIAAATSSHPEGDFCRDRIDAQGRLHVFVYNQAAGSAGPSQTQVYFRVPSGAEGQKSCGDGCAQVDVPTPTLTGAGNQHSIIDLVIDIPEGCFGSAFGPDDINNCRFKIAVDATNAVMESNELNNTAGGACQGLL